MSGVASRRARALALVAACASLALGPTAAADTPPSVWEKARDPAAADAYQIHEEVQRRIVRLGREAEDSALYQASLQAALGILISNHAESSKSPLLRFDLAEIYEERQDYPRAAQLYRSAIAEFPDHPATSRAWLGLAFACGHLGDNACERECYTKVLQIETEDILRATPTLNLAETQMHLGDLKEAVEGYREALRIAGRFPMGETAPLATWGLAVALDRSGDRPGAEREARFALELERSMGIHGLLRSKKVFFVPAYELHWYDGLGAIARARVAPSARDAVTLWSLAESAFAAYVAAAEPKHDRWLAIAKTRLAQVKAERARAERNVTHEPPPPPHDGRAADRDVTL